MSIINIIFHIFFISFSYYFHIIFMLSFPFRNPVFIEKFLCDFYLYISCFPFISLYFNCFSILLSLTFSYYLTKLFCTLVLTIPLSLYLTLLYYHFLSFSSFIITISLFSLILLTSLYSR